MKGIMVHGVDTRGFVYALGPYLQKQQWELQRLELALAQSANRLRLAQDHCDSIRQQCEQQVQSLKGQMDVRPDPTAHRNGLLFLATLKRQLVSAEAVAATCAQDKEAARLACLSQQLRLDALEQHRDDALQSFALERARTEAAEADRDWMGRLLQGERWA